MGTLRMAHAKRLCLLFSTFLCIVTLAQLHSTNKENIAEKKRIIILCWKVSQLKVNYKLIYI